MKVSGFTFIRNGDKFDYPYLEAIKSILPICDEMIVVVGNSEDDTRLKVMSLNDPKIKIIDTIWDESLREGGKILAVQTDIAMDHITGDWGFYIQGDEVLHEKYLDTVLSEMKKYKDKPEVEGLLFGYEHFYGSYDYLGDSPRWYRREIRVIKNDKKIRSYKDAQGFRKENQKLKVKLIDAKIYHYGWVRDPRAQNERIKIVSKYWHSDDEMEKHILHAPSFDYNTLESLKPFKDTHPAVMTERLKKAQWDYHYDPSQKKLPIKDQFKVWIENLTGYRIGEYKNYRII